MAAAVFAAAAPAPFFDDALLALPFFVAAVFAAGLMLLSVLAADTAVADFADLDAAVLDAAGLVAADVASRDVVADARATVFGLEARVLEAPASFEALPVALASPVAAFAAFAGAVFGAALPLDGAALPFVALAFVAPLLAALLAAAFFGAARFVFVLSDTVEEVAAFIARPKPLFLPPPSCLLTVAHARLSASPPGTPRSS